ncbi:flagellar basal-body rod protein FlgB [Polynucleobacter aenigmaticus]|uniref:Flagellar basal body rod protein FlgB n=1 Tax=Polynucleobacter aenigmaticus TaxID=1743164 RepID=A0A254PZ73_9BURK|nr:flagellar basal body rod protein FlgB [Polynucleobacter aenigmaticus]OWS71860.1 flagellar basal-body rod protein FlgB [Polynucleobacter aenigmaticus]
MNNLDTLFGFHQTALKVREQRQELLAANIANSDTPNYKARDIDFAKALQVALASNGQAAGTKGAIATSSPLHLTPDSSKAGAVGDFGEVLYRSSIQGSVDGNTVDGDVERNAFTDNAIRYEASLTMLKLEIRDMLAAIQNQ